jgi:hypothetical protein
MLAVSGGALAELLITTEQLIKILQGKLKINLQKYNVFLRFRDKHTTKLKSSIVE